MDETKIQLEVVGEISTLHVHLLGGLPFAAPFEPPLELIPVEPYGPPEANHAADAPLPCEVINGTWGHVHKFCDGTHFEESTGRVKTWRFECC